MKELLRTFYRESEHDTIRVEIYYDEYATSPREWDNLSEMVCFHPRYYLGDYNEGHDSLNPQETGPWYTHSPDDLIEYIESNPVVYLPLILYDHGGLTISTSRNGWPFNCPWDSGVVGIAFVHLSNLSNEWPNLSLEELGRKGFEVIQSEVYTYDQYLRGDVYYFLAYCDHCNELIDSCGGFYGDDEEENGMMDYIPTTCPYCDSVAQAYRSAGA